MSEENTTVQRTSKKDESKSVMLRMREKWGLTSNLQVVLILIVFALAGSSIMFIRPLIFGVLGLQDLEGPLYWLLYLIFIFPVYQINLLIFGFLFGQFAFFLDKEKKMLRAIGRLFTGKKKAKSTSPGS